MRRRSLSKLDGLGLGQLPGLVCLTVCFAVGAVAGCLFAGALGEASQVRLTAYLRDYLTALRDGDVILPSLFSTVWELSRWPLLAFLLGFTALGVPGLPAVFLVRGFLMSYSAAVFVRLFGGAGLLAALGAFGVSGLFSLPALFILGVDALGSAGALAGGIVGESRRAPLLRPGQLARAGGCCGLLALGAAAQSWLTPVLLRTAAELLP